MQAMQGQGKGMSYQMYGQATRMSQGGQGGGMNFQTPQYPLGGGAMSTDMQFPGNPNTMPHGTPPMMYGLPKVQGGGFAPWGYAPTVPPGYMYDGGQQHFAEDAMQQRSFAVQATQQVPLQSARNFVKCSARRSISRARLQARRWHWREGRRRIRRRTCCGNAELLLERPLILTVATTGTIAREAADGGG